MIKEIFEIESKQKNTLLCLIGIYCICFLQLYLFKENILTKSSLEIIGLSLALTVCWSVLNLPPILLFLVFSTNYPKEHTRFKYEKIIPVLGIFALCWTTLITYIAYELIFCFKELIRIAIILTVLRSLFWIFMIFLKRK